MRVSLPPESLRPARVRSRMKSRFSRPAYSVHELTKALGGVSEIMLRATAG